MVDDWENEGGRFIYEKYNLMSDCPISVKHRRRQGVIAIPMWKTINQETLISKTWKKTLSKAGVCIPRTIRG